MQTVNLSIRGYLVGSIWMLAIECWKHLNYDITREDSRFLEEGPFCNGEDE